MGEGRRREKEANEEGKERQDRIGRAEGYGKNTSKNE